MIGLTRLYPRGWRDRYEAELLELLSERPPSLADRLDLVRGALDAHLHRPTGPALPWTDRLPGIPSLGAGLLWAATFIGVGIGGDDRLLGSLVPPALLAMLVAVPGRYLLNWSGRIAIGLGVLAIAVALFQVAPWEISGLIFLVGFATLLSATLTLVAIRAGLGVVVRWWLVFGSVVLPMATITGTVLVGRVDEAVARVIILSAVPYGLAWFALGLRIVAGGIRPSIDPPSTGRQIGVPA